MMHVKVIAVGKLKERFWKEACAEYEKRLSRYIDLDIVEVDDCDPERHGGDERAREAEAELILRHIPDAKQGTRRIVALDIAGKQLSSEEFASFLDTQGVEGCSDLVFVIGGPTGLDRSILDMAKTRLSFGKITLPHNLARVVLLEQLYRANRINRGEPYHK